MEINNIVKEESLKTTNNTTDGMLKKDEHLTKYSDTRINRLCTILNRQINKLKKLIQESGE